MDVFGDVECDTSTYEFDCDSCGKCHGAFLWAGRPKEVNYRRESHLSPPGGSEGVYERERTKELRSVDDFCIKNGGV